jgi:hypothetical protein
MRDQGSAAALSGICKRLVWDTRNRSVFVVAHTCFVNGGQSITSSR